MVPTAIAVLLITIIHAGTEYRDDALSRWLAADIGFTPRRWLARAFYLLAAANILAPLVIALATGSHAAWAVTAGALAADAFCTHIVPSISDHEFAAKSLGPVPGIATTPLQLLASLAIAVLTHGLSAVWLMVGVSLFAPLRPTLQLLAWWDNRIVEG
jgi:hypothetical protein